VRKPDLSLATVIAMLGAAVLLCDAGAALAQDQNSQGTFSGAIAPAPKDKKEYNKSQAGYKNVMPGYVAPEKAQPPEPEEKLATEPEDKEPVHAMSTPAEPQMSHKPGTQKFAHFPTAEEIRQFAAATGVEISLPVLPEELTKDIHIRKKVYGLVSGPQPRMDGMLPVEFTTKRTIDQIMQEVGDPGLSDDARKKAVDTALSRLNYFDTWLRSRAGVPDSVYAAMGVPAVYVDETREGATKSDARVKDAIKQLRDMESQGSDQGSATGSDQGSGQDQ
jgi:hypothetical protein